MLESGTRAVNRTPWLRPVPNAGLDAGGPRGRRFQPLRRASRRVNSSSTPHIEPRPVPAASAQPRPLVIVVDDALPVRLLASRMLTEAGYDVLSAPDGAAAVTLIQGLRAPPDLVITDLRMPVMGGEALGQWLMAQYAQVPVIYMSGFVPQTTGELPGILLDKPFTPDVLLKAVGEAVHTAPREAEQFLPGAASWRN